MRRSACRRTASSTSRLRRTAIAAHRQPLRVGCTQRAGRDKRRARDGRIMAGVMRIVIVGAGPAGLAMAMRLKQAGHTDFTIVERSSGVGGTWHDNRYPGCGCDVPSHLYCFSFAPKPDWRHKFARQSEIEQYFKDCVERFGLEPHLQLATEVQGARFEGGIWHIRTSRGELTADVL